jgi:hypothetical protein
MEKGDKVQNIKTGKTGEVLEVYRTLVWASARVKWFDSGVRTWAKVETLKSLK